MMNADEIARLCGSMSLTEREGPVRTLKTNLKEAGLRRMVISLVRKVMSPKPVNRDVFRVVMRKIWQTREGVEIESELEGKGEIQRMVFNKAEFWIQIHNAPLICMSEEIGRFLGSIVGEVVQFDECGSGAYMEKFLRVRVILEIDKPLRKCLRVDVLGDRAESVMLVRHERLSDFCFQCGILGHTFKDCLDKPTHLEGNKSEEFLFGFWMQASAPPKRFMNGGKRWPYNGRGNGSSFRDHGEKGNLRVMGWDGEGGDGGRRESSWMVISGNRQQDPCLESESKGKVNETKNDYGNIERLEGLPGNLVMTKIQETIDLETMGLNTVREWKEENNGPLPSGSSVRGMLGLGHIDNLKGQAGSLERLISFGNQVSGGRDQLNVLIGLNKLGTLPLGPVFNFGDPNNNNSSINLDPSKVLEKASQQIVLGDQSPQ
ncbi:hypothetical protein EZV62_012351 [Acer yangbiense]|uniref:CCHC-type domain-containing protein n=1 Tax=Acer yangbiense TaxID=1000413 RepID=A0A5C7HW22_9ROSI|nr:hypothetical protein EZV62_012351 [Acer yangbiense]